MKGVKRAGRSRRIPHNSLQRSHPKFSGFQPRFEFNTESSSENGILRLRDSFLAASLRMTPSREVFQQPPRGHPDERRDFLAEHPNYCIERVAVDEQGSSPCLIAFSTASPAISRSVKSFASISAPTAGVVSPTDSKTDNIQSRVRVPGMRDGTRFEPAAAQHVTEGEKVLQNASRVCFHPLRCKPTSPFHLAVVGCPAVRSRHSSQEP